jgi:predicted negative regulator of RcsB-dependent stress response
MSIQKQKFAIIVLASVVLAGGGMIGYQFYQEKQNEAVIETQQQVQEEASEVASGIVETKVISAEMNPTQENIEAAEEAVTSLPESEEKKN